MTSALDMINSLKFNNRRKSVHTPFSKDKKSYEKGQPVVSKDLSQFEKDLLLKKLKENRVMENKHRVYKMIISFGLTIIVIGGIVFIIKFTFF